MINYKKLIYASKHEHILIDTMLIWIIIWFLFVHGSIVVVSYYKIDFCHFYIILI